MKVGRFVQTSWFAQPFWLISIFGVGFTIKFKIVETGQLGFNGFVNVKVTFWVPVVKVGGKLFRITAVSYTHLDVYKRQQVT